MNRLIIPLAKHLITVLFVTLLLQEFYKFCARLLRELLMCDSIYLVW